MMRGMKCAFCSGVPHCRIVLPTIWMPNTSLGVPGGTPTLLNSSAMMTCSSGLSPPPSNSFGHDGASSPFACNVLRHCCANGYTSSRGSAPMPFHPSGRCSERNVRIRSRNASASGVYVGFMTQNLPAAPGSTDADVQTGGAPGERGSTDERPCIAEPAANHASTSREVEAGRRIDLRLSGGEEHVAEPEGDRAGHAGQT